MNYTLHSANIFLQIASHKRRKTQFSNFFKGIHIYCTFVIYYHLNAIREVKGVYGMTLNNETDKQYSCNKNNKLMKLQYEWILKTLSTYDTSTISIQEAIAIAQTFTSGESLYCKSIHRFLVELGLDKASINAITKTYLQQALALNYSQREIQQHFAIFANCLMKLTAETEPHLSSLGEHEKKELLDQIKMNIKNP